MRKLVLFAHISLDGFAGDVDGGLGFLSYNEELEQYAEDLVKTVGAPLYGKTTYQLMDGYWPSELNNPEAGKFSSQHAQWVHDIPKVVFSTTLDGVTWNNTTLIRENIEEEVNKLKEQPGKDLVIFGSPGLAKSFMKLGLIDEFKLTLHPVILGNGISLFDGGIPTQSLKLLETSTLKSGVVTLHYSLIK